MNITEIRTKNSNRPKFNITLIGKTNDLVFNHWRSELLRIKLFLQNATRKCWDMNLTCQFCTKYEFEKKFQYLKQQWPIEDGFPLILTENRVFSDLKQFYVKYLKQKLGITEMNLFKQMELNEVREIIQLAVQESIKSQLKPNDSRDFGYVKLFDDDTNDIISVLFQLNKVCCPNMVNIFLSFLGEGVFNDYKQQQIQFMEVLGFQTGQNNIEGGFIDTESYSQLKGTGFREEKEKIKHDQKGIFGITYKDDAKGQIVQMGLNFNFDANLEFDTKTSLYMALGQVIYGLSDLATYCNKIGKNNKNVNLRIVESGKYVYSNEDFQITQEGIFQFQPNMIENEGYRMRKILAQRERERIEKERIEEEQRQKEEEQRQLEEQERLEQEEIERKRIEEEKLVIEKRKQAKQARRDKGEDVTDSSDDEVDEDEARDTFEVQENFTSKLGLQRQTSMGTNKSETLNNMGTQKSDQATVGSSGDTTELPTFALMMKQSSKIEQDKLNMETIDEEYEINEEKLQFLYILGKGAFGSVSVVYDSDTKQRYARKEFSNIDDYLEERDLMKNIETQFGDDLEEIGAGMKKYNNQNKTIYYEIGSCSLNDLMQLRRKYKVYWFDREPEIIFLLKEVIRMFKIMFAKKAYHTDLKPANLILCQYQGKTNKNEYYIKLIDFGSISFNYQEIKALTRDYYYPKIEDYLPIESQDKREKFEMYTLGRTIQTIMLSSIWEKENAKERLYFENSLEGIQESMVKLKAYYSEGLVGIVEQLLLLKDLSEIEEEISKFTVSNVNDKENLISRIIALKKEEALKDQQNTTSDTIESASSHSQKDIYDNLQQMWDNQLQDTGLQLIDKMDPAEVQADLRIVVWKIKYMKKIGMFAKAMAFVKEVNGNITDEKKKYYEELEDPVVKWAYLEFKLYFAWTKPISNGRFEEWELHKDAIVKEFGEDSLQYAFTEFWCGWLYLGDKRYEKSIEHLEIAQKIYENKFPDGKSLLLAEVLRYMGQDYYQLREADKSLEIYTREANIRKELEGDMSGEYAVVLNSIASIYGHLKGEKQKGLEKIEECINIYYNSIGEKNQNCVIALDWKGWYLNQLERYEEAQEVWEYCLVKAYQVFGPTYHVFKTLLNSHLWALYPKLGIDYSKAIMKGFVIKSQQLYSVEDYQESLDYIQCGLLFNKKIYDHYGDTLKYQQVQKSLQYREQLAEFKLNQKQAIDNMKSLQLQNDILKVCDIEQIDEYFNAISKKCELQENLKYHDDALKTLQDYLMQLKSLYKKLEVEKKDIVKKYTGEKEFQFSEIEEENESDDEEEKKYINPDRFTKLQCVDLLEDEENQEKKEGDQEQNQEELNQENIPQKEEEKDEKEQQQQENEQQQEENEQKSEKQEVDKEGTTTVIIDKTEKIEGEDNTTEKVKKPDNIKLVMKALSQQNREKIRDKKQVEQIIIENVTNQKLVDFQKQEEQFNLIQEKRQKLLRAKTQAQIKEKLDELFENKDIEIDEKDKLRIQTIDNLFEKQSQGFFNIYIRLYDCASAQNLIDESMYYISKALQYTQNKQLINQGQARLLKILEIKKNSIGQINKQKQIDISKNNKFTFDSKNHGKYGDDKLFELSQFKNNTVNIRYFAQALAASDQMQNGVHQDRNIVMFVAHAQQPLSFKEKTTFAFKVENGQHYFGGVGICQVQKVKRHLHLMRNKVLLRSGHGLYMITPNGMTINSMDQTQNFVEKSSFFYSRSDIIICEFDPQNKKLTFTKKSNGRSVTLNAPFDKTKEYAVAVGLAANPQDSYTVISQMDYIDIYENDKQALYEIVEQQMVLMASQVGEDSIKYWNLRKEISILYYSNGLLQESKQKLLECIQQAEEFKQQYDLFRDPSIQQQLNNMLQHVQTRIDND